MTRRGHRYAAVVLVAVVTCACGKKGNPLAPVRPAPGPPGDVRVTRYDDRVEIRVTVPAENHDKSTPPVVERLELYAISTPAVPAAAPAAPAAATPPATPPTAATPATPATGPQAPAPVALMVPKNLLQTIEVERPKQGTAPVATDPRPAPGETATFIDKTVTGQIGTADAPTRHYLAVGVAGRNRRGPTTAVISVPLATTVAPPANIAITYDDRMLRLTWTPGPANRAYHVDEVVRGAAGPDARKTLTASPTTVAQFATPVEMGRERCFVVRSVEIGKTAQLQGASSDPVCETPVDRFPPPAPDPLVAVPGEAAVDLSWTAVDASDLAGYVVLRGEGAGGTLQALMTSPIAQTQYRDGQVRSGVTYIYAVVALDKAGNASPQSRQVQVTAR